MLLNANYALVTFAKRSAITHPLRFRLPVSVGYNPVSDPRYTKHAASKEPP